MNSVRKDEFIKTMNQKENFLFIKVNCPEVADRLEYRVGTLDFNNYVNDLEFVGRETKWKNVPQDVVTAAIELNEIHDIYFELNLNKEVV
jgi:hypothetical protein